MIGTSVISADYLLFNNRSSSKFSKFGQGGFKSEGLTDQLFSRKLVGLWMEYVVVRPRFGTMRDIRCGACAGVRS